MSDPEEPTLPTEDVAAALEPEAVAVEPDAVEVEAQPDADEPEAVEPDADEPDAVAVEPDADDEEEPEPPPAAQAVTGSPKAPAPPPGKARPDLLDRKEPLYRECQGFRLRLDPPDLARLRELAGSRGKSDDELGEAFFDGQADRLAASLAGDVPTPSEIRVVVDPYSRQAFLALENRIRGILSF